jgi:hypothetical protein
MVVQVLSVEHLKLEARAVPEDLRDLEAHRTREDWLALLRREILRVHIRQV